MLPIVFARRDDLFRRYEEEFNKIFDQIYSQPFINKDSVGRTYPKTDIYKDGDDLVVEALCPFTQREYLTVDIQRFPDGTEPMLTISYRGPKEPFRNEGTYFVHELSPRHGWTRSFYLPEEILTRCPEPTVTLKDAILTIRFQGGLKEDPQYAPRKLEIR